MVEKALAAESGVATRSVWRARAPARPAEAVRGDARTFVNGGSQHLPQAAVDAPRTVNTLISSTGYFATMGTPILRGRDFSEADRGDGTPAAVINQAFARRFFGEKDPIGRRIGTGFDRDPDRQIVGVVSDTRDRGLGREVH